MTESPPRVAAVGPEGGPSPSLLEIDDVAMRFGGIVALDAVTFSVAKGRIMGLIGPNGAGKTTLFNCLSRLYRPVRGDIRLNGQSLRRCAPADIAALGVGRTFQAPALFASMSVLDNVKVGAHARGRKGSADRCADAPVDAARGAGVRPNCARHAGVRRARANGRTAGRKPTLVDRKRVELARALAAQPLLLLLDEPAGEASTTTRSAELGSLIRSIRDQLGITVLLVEHHMGLVMSFRIRSWC